MRKQRRTISSRCPVEERHHVRHESALANRPAEPTGRREVAEKHAPSFYRLIGDAARSAVMGQGSALENPDADIGVAGIAVAPP